MGDIAVIGMSCKFPNSENIEEYWDIIANGKDATSKLPKDRWTPRQPEYEDTHGGFLKSAVDEFDANFFGISPREAQMMDPQQRMLLEVTWTALENSAINPVELKGTRTGVFIGIWRNDYENLCRKLSDVNEFQTYMGNSFSVASARISFFLKLIGSNVATDAACSSSLMSIHLACQSLRSGESSMAITGGINLLIHPFNKSTMEHLLSADGRCKTFDEMADGYGRGEGCGILILKNISDAIRDGDRILALIKGSGVSQEGTSSSFGTPSKECQVAAIKNAFKSCKMDPLDVDFVEAHGTGTPKGDPIEISAIAEVYGKGRVVPLIISSVKTNIGHTESAAGVAGIIKLILAMNKGIVPPHINLKKLNPLINLDSIPAVIPNSSIVWEKLNGRKRTAAINSFGVSGTNVHLLLQEPYFSNDKDEDFNLVRPDHILTLSAKSMRALDEIIKNYVYFLSNHPEINLGDTCFSANTGRSHLSHRVSVHSSNVKEMVEKLQRKYYFRSNEVTKKRKVVFLFPGQGTQYGNMGKELYVTHPVFRDALDYICKIFEKLTGQSLLQIIFSEPEKPILHQSLYSQISIFCIQYSLLQLWKSFGIIPDVVIGHSVGEFAASFAAGAMSISQVTKLLYIRTRLISKLSIGGMIVLKCSLEKCQSLLKDFTENSDNGWADVACVNSPEQIVLSAKKDTIAKLESACRACDIKTFILASHHAYHSRDMDSILDEYEETAKTLNYQLMKCQYISGMSGCLLDPVGINAKYWLDHCREKVNYEKAMQTAMDENCGVFIEIGPQPILLGLGMQCVLAKDIQWLPSIKQKEKNWKTLLSSLSKLYVSGHDIDWKGFDRAYRRKKISLPTYPFQRQKFWFNLHTKRSLFLNKGQILHPLVGKRSQVSGSVKYFQNTIDLKKFPYLADHRVARKSILPISAILEILMAAGQLTLQNDRKSVEPISSLVIKELSISSPFLLDDQECLSEVVVNALDSKSFSVKLNSATIDDNETIIWKQCAEGIFFPVLEKSDRHQMYVDLDEIKSASKESSSDELYSNLHNVGWTHDVFKSITNIWRNDKHILAQVELHETFDNKILSNYLCHPFLIDGMLQLYLFSLQINNTDLNLPVRVNKYTWLATSNSKIAYAYCRFEKDKTPEVALYGENGQLLLILEDIVVERVTAKSFLKSIHSNVVQLPEIYKEKWIAKSGIYSDRVNMQVIQEKHFYKSSLSLIMTTINKLTNENLPYEESLSKLAYFYIVKAFGQLGWNPKLGEKIDHIQVTESLKLLSSYIGFIFRLFEILAEEKILQLKSAKNVKTRSEWQIINELPLLPEINSAIEIQKSKVNENISFLGRCLEIFSTCAENLACTLEGKGNPIEFLFNTDKNKVCMENLYSDTAHINNSNMIIVKYLNSFTELQKNNVHLFSDKKIKILEIGAGTGATSSSVLDFFNSASVTYSYTFSDISPIFLNKAKEKFEAYLENMEFKLLNIEDDPFVQGFAPEQFDIIIAANVLHATRVLEESILNCRRLLTAGGSVLIYETFVPDRAFDIMFGVLDGYHRFSDFSLRPFHTVIDETKWCDLLKATGFESNSCYMAAKGKGVIIAQANYSFYSHPSMYASKNKRAWIIISDGKQLVEKLKIYLGNMKRNNYVVKTDNLVIDFRKITRELLKKRNVIEGIIYLRNECENKGEIVDGINDFLKITQFILTQSLSMTAKLVLITQGNILVHDQIPVRPTDGVYWGYFKSLKIENRDMKVICIDLDPNEKDDMISAKHIIMEIFSNNGMMETQIAIRKSDRLVARLTKVCDTLPPLSWPNATYFSISLPESSVPLKYDVFSKPVLGEYEVEVAVKAIGLNSKDFIANAKLKNTFFDMNNIGSEFSGTISKLGSKVCDFAFGDPVFGLAKGVFGLSSHVVVNHNLIIRKPDIITHNGAATIPVAFCASIYVLEKIAKLRKSDTVLIHGATDGFGLSAIQICKMVGAKIVVTAGSHRKRAYLRSLGIKHVFDFGSTSDGTNIKEAVGGVDIIISSSSWPLLKETDLSICNKNARIVELGSVNTLRYEEVLSLIPDVSYSTLNLDDLSSEMIQGMLCSVAKYLTNGAFKEIPTVQFDGRHILDAIKYFKEGHLIGKIVVVMPTTFYLNGSVSRECRMFNEEGSYLITGELDKMGIEVVKFLSGYGAKNIVVVHSKSPTESVQAMILSLKEQCINILALQYDVGDFLDCQKLLVAIRNPQLRLPPLKGVVHFANSSLKSAIPDQKIDTFQSICDSTVNGAWNLHSLTKNYNLEYFLMFSSIDYSLSPFGFSHSCSSNAYLCSLAQYRYSLGLQGTSINWGPWSDVGVTALRDLESGSMCGILPISPAQGILALKYVLRKNFLKVVVGNIDTESYLHAYPQQKLYVENICDTNENFEPKKESPTYIDSDTFYKTIVEFRSNKEKIRDFLEVQIRNLVKDILMLDSGFLDGDQTFLDMGMDSIMTIEFRSKLQILLGKRITLAEVLKGNRLTVNLLAINIMSNIPEKMI